MQLDQGWLLAQGEDAMLLHFVSTAFERYPKRVAVAVSGGGDSMALLHLCHRIGAQNGTQYIALTVDHQLRPESAQEAESVSAFCAKIGVPHHTLVWTHAGLQGNIAAKARDARYVLISKWCKSNNVSRVLLGHTLDDQAENFIMRLARKSGVEGLASMQTRFDREGLRWARPLWQQERAALRAYLRDHNVAWIEDPTNVDPKYARTQARTALKALEPLGITKRTLHDVSFGLRWSAEALRHYTIIAARDHVTSVQGDLILKIDPTDNVPLDIKRRLWRSMAQWISQSDYPPRDKALFDVVTEVPFVHRKTVGGALITQEGTTWRITREYNAVRNLTCPTDEIWDNRWQLSGPHSSDLHIAALGEAIKDCPEWRKSGLPRTSLIGTPAVWQGQTLIAAPLAGYNDQWTAQIVADSYSSQLTH